MTPDPFATQRLRDAALAAWTGHPARFREDANSEEDHGRGYYRDRVVVELAQNAADAAARAGVPGRLLLRLDVTPGGAVLVAANTGAPLDAAGVESLASLRASAKRSDGAAETVGRFGVGFAAVRSVADEVAVASRTGAVHFSLLRTSSALAAVPADLASEVGPRGASLPVLRLPFPGAGPADDLSRDLLADGWDTVVVLALRDDAAVGAVRWQLRAVDDALLLALPALGRVDVEDGSSTRTLEDVRARWVVATRTGALDTALLRDRPVEERGRTAWQVTWAAPRVGSGEAGLPAPARAPGMPVAMVHAPTPTEEPSTLPALLIGTFPLDPTRRHIAHGAVTDALVAHAGRTFADLLVACRDAADAPDPLDLLPPTLPAGPFDAAVRQAALAAAREVPLLRPADGGPPLRPEDAVAVSGAAGQDVGLLTVLAHWLPLLVHIPSRHRHLLPLLGIGRTDLADLVDALPYGDPEALRTLYDALGAVDSGTLEQLATLPVPLADGRTVRGARGAVLLDGELDATVAGSLSRWGLRVVHPAAAHPLLERLGAGRADAAAVLRHPVVRERVLEADDDDVAEGEVGGTAAVVLALVRAALQQGGALTSEPWWGEVLLPAEDGATEPARGLVLPGSDASRWFDTEVLPPVDAALARGWAEELAALGVRTGLTVVRIGSGTDVEGETREDDVELLTEALDGWDGYVEDVLGADADEPLPGEALTDLVVVADLDAVRPEAWNEVLQALGRGDARRALVEPVRLPADGATTRSVPSYTAWWFRHRSSLGLGRSFLVGGSGGSGGSEQAGRAPSPLASLLSPAPAVLDGLDREVLRALGGIVDTGDLDGPGWAELAEHLPDVGTVVPVSVAVQLWRGLVTCVAADPDVELDLPRLPALDGDGRCVMAGSDEVAVADPMWAQRTDLGPLVVVPPGMTGALCDALDVDAAAEGADGRVTSRGHRTVTSSAVLQVFPGAPPTWQDHDDLEVDGRPVDWWLERPAGGPIVHASTTAGLARALATVVGWQRRDTVERLLTDPGSADDVLLEAAGEGPA